jgi:hypothetical protein
MFAAGTNPGLEADDRKSSAGRDTRHLHSMKKTGPVPGFFIDIEATGIEA